MKRLLLGLTILTAFAAADAYACSCAFQSRAQLFNRASTVFVGEVVSYENDVATFRVLRPFKGVAARTVQVRTVYSSVSCGYGEMLAPKSRHLIYAYSASKGLSTNFCSGNGPVNAMKTEILMLQTQTWFLRAQRGDGPG